MTLNIDMEKSRARLQAKAVRAAAHEAAAGAELIGHFPAGRFRESKIIGGFWPIQSEINVLPLLEALEGMGHILALPCTPRTGKPLTFRRWAFGGKLKTGPHNTREPFPEAPELFPDLVLVPLLAFTQTGDRLGYGGGFYDRTLEKLRKTRDVFACGVAYAAQQADHLPIGPYDAPLSGMLTDQYFKEFS